MALLPQNSCYPRKGRCLTTEVTEGAEGMSVRQASKHELAAAQRSRYLQASAAEKGRILDEFVAATGYHRKHAVRLLRAGPPPPRAGHGGRPRTYDAVVVGALR